MRFLSLAFMVGGAVGAAIAAAQTDPGAPNWVGRWQVNTGLFVVSLVLLAVGIGLRQRLQRGLHSATSDTRPQWEAAREALEALANSTDSLETVLRSRDLHALTEELDRTLKGPAQDFAENRQALLDQGGMEAYTAVMAPFAQAERYLNRAWSASVDGYWEEAAEYTRRAFHPITEAYRQFASTAAR